MGLHQMNKTDEMIESRWRQVALDLALEDSSPYEKRSRSLLRQLKIRNYIKAFLYVGLPIWISFGMWGIFQLEGFERMASIVITLVGGAFVDPLQKTVSHIESLHRKLDSFRIHLMEKKILSIVEIAKFFSNPLMR